LKQTFKNLQLSLQKFLVSYKKSILFPLQAPFLRRLRDAERKLVVSDQRVKVATFRQLSASRGVRRQCFSLMRPRGGPIKTRASSPLDKQTNDLHNWVCIGDERPAMQIRVPPPPVETVPR